MVENQHRQISGYRDLSEAEIALMNAIKAAEREVAMIHADIVSALPPRSEATRQAALARTEFEAAFMRLARAVAQPNSPWEG